MRIDAELEEFASIWREDTPAEDERLVRELARRAGWRGRLMRYADYGIAVALTGGIGALVLLKGSTATAATGLMLVLAFWWLTSKRQALWEVEHSLAHVSREKMLANAAHATQARLKRTNLSLAAIVPCFFLGLWFGSALANGEVDTIGELGSALVQRAHNILPVTLMTIGLVIYLLRSRTRLTRKLRNIEELGLAYREEDMLDRRF
jgi:hypothetical protein